MFELYIFKLFFERFVSFSLFLILSPLFTIYELYLFAKRFLYAYFSSPQSLFTSIQKGPWQLENKVIVITGASSGIGKSLAFLLSHKYKNLKLCLLARRTELLKEVKEECLRLAKEACQGKDEGCGDFQVEIGTVDLTNEEQVKHFMRLIGRKYGRIDALVLNAGQSMGEFLYELDQKSEIFEQINAVNYLGNVYAILHALPFLEYSKQARILLVSSLLGIAAGPSRTGYSASKFALNGLVESLRTEFGMIQRHQHISISMCYPGRVATEINQNRLGKNPAKFDNQTAMSVEVCAKWIEASLKTTWIRDEPMGVLGKLLHWTKGVWPFTADELMAKALMSVQKQD